MDNKNILIIGLGMTGQSAIEALKPLAKNLYVYDDNKDMTLEAPEGTSWYQGQDLDLIVKSPGIPLSNPFVHEIMKKYPLISDIELAYRLTRCKNIVAITGTNGKTTMTRLLEEVVKESGRRPFIGGNVGVGILPLALEAGEEDIMVIECSSFQLETIENFKPKIAIISNITEDHLDHHKDLEAYRESKKNIFKNQDESDYLILNIDDPYSAQVGEEEDRAYVVSLLPIQQKGAFLSEGALYYNLGEGPVNFMDRKDLKILGDHNTRNILEVLLAALLLGIGEEDIRNAFIKFNGVEHRIEFVTEYKGVKFYNDSKGTNPASSEVAISSMPGPVHLLAGGYDKGISFRSMLEKSRDRLKGIYLFGQTSQAFYGEAKEVGIDSVEIFENMEEALNQAFEKIEPGDVLLLSPACASWDQFKNHEERGRLFKEYVRNKTRS